MSDDSYIIPPSKRTVEIYRDLLQVEVRALVGRVTELTQTVGALFGEVNNIAVQIEESTSNMERVGNGLSYCRKEISSMKQTIHSLDAIEERVTNAEKKLAEIQKQLDGKT